MPRRSSRRAERSRRRREATASAARARLSVSDGLQFLQRTDEARGECRRALAIVVTSSSPAARMELDRRSLRPSGIGRYFVAALLLAWLVGWAAGEGAALLALGAILSAAAGLFREQMPEWISHPASTGAAVFVILFLAVWLTLWTIGGLAALTFFVRSLWGEDILALTPDGFELIRRGGPFRRRYHYDRGAIRRIRLRPQDKILVIDGATESRTVNFGSPDERQEAAEWLTRSLTLPDEAAIAAAAMPPASWEITEDVGGTRLGKVRMRARFIRSAILWFVTALTASAWMAF